LRLLFEQHLERVEWDENRFPIRLYPFMIADPVSAEWLIAAQVDRTGADELARYIA
jgi:hypothetical protein